MITCARIGNSPLTIDWTSLYLIPAGTGKTARKHEPDPAEVSQAWAKLKAQFDSGQVGFFNAPDDNLISQLSESVAMARSILERSPELTDVLFLGIGGSALGPISLLSALKHKCNKINFHFMENPDATHWIETLKPLKPESTLVVVAAKSGGTFETLAQFQVALEWLGRNRWKTNIVAITDPENGDLRKFVTSKEIPSLSVAPSIGGRFSIFTPVGLFAGALAGLDMEAFVLGARQVKDYCLKAPLEKNPLFNLGSHFIAHFPSKNAHVCMPYSTPLRLLGNWWVQLWGESLGKDGKGFTPVPGLGATDQHSLLQLLRDGPNDKITFFINVEKVDDPVSVPRLSDIRLDSFARLQGTSFHSLLNIEYQAIATVLTRRERPHLSFRIEALDERNLGSLYFSFCVLTAMTGTLWGVNPFDQPGVEDGKVLILEALAREFQNRND
jgi:glucose-6-phosphate isomerase